jgi:hypothetical protein
MCRNYPCQSSAIETSFALHKTYTNKKMIKLALLVRLEAKPGKEKELESFLENRLPLAKDEKQTITIEFADVIAARLSV